MKSIEKLNNRLNSTNSMLCIGLDTSIEKLPAGVTKDIYGLLDFNLSIIEATREYATAYKVNFAFYEEYGIEGMEALKKTFEAIPPNVFSIADAKRGDIGNTSRAYAKMCFEHYNADSITVSPYMGSDSVMPFLEYSEKFVFLLGLTSNPGSADFQRLKIGNEMLYEKVFETSSQWAGAENLGYVVGATHPEELAKLRNKYQDRVFLIPGVGTQGGDANATVEANAGGLALINASRALIYASSSKNYAEKATEKAIEYFELLKYK
jgi:orotidine-5'-phosphate decarboxylase